MRRVDIEPDRGTVERRPDSLWPYTGAADVRYTPRGSPLPESSRRPSRRGGRVVECAGFEIRYTVPPYRGFESLPLRHFRPAGVAWSETHAFADAADRLLAWSPRPPPVRTPRKSCSGDGLSGAGTRLAHPRWGGAACVRAPKTEQRSRRFSRVRNGMNRTGGTTMPRWRRERDSNPRYAIKRILP